MAKVKFTKKMKCVNVQSSIGRASVSFASDIKELPAQPGGTENRLRATAKNVVSINFENPADAAGYTPGKEYNVTISE